jgi:branched-chain amino acid transport system permease protein
MNYLLHLLTLSFINLILAISLDLLVGFAGLLSLAHAAFFGIGAYSTALLVRHGFDAISAMMIGALVAALASSFIALPSIRVRGIYLLIITVAVQSVFTVVLLNLSGLTGGPAGIPNIPPLTLFGQPLRGLPLTGFIGTCSLLLFFFLRRLGHSPFGHLLQAIRDDETACATLGKNVGLAKISAFALAGALAAIAGSLYAHYTSYVDPRGFDILVSISILVMVMLGGAGTIYGPAIGAFIVTLLPEALRFVPSPPGSAGASRQLCYGLLLILIIFLRPQGLFGKGVRNNHAN